MARLADALLADCSKTPDPTTPPVTTSPPALSAEVQNAAIHRSILTTTRQVVTFFPLAAQFCQRRMKTIAELNEESFEPTIAAADLPVVVDFYAPWCGPCKMIAPLLDKLAEHFLGQLQFFKVNVDEAPELAARYEITGVPTLLLINQGEVRDDIVGFPSPRELVAQLEALAALNGATAAAEVRP